MNEGGRRGWMMKEEEEGERETKVMKEMEVDKERNHSPFSHHHCLPLILICEGVI